MRVPVQLIVQGGESGRAFAGLGGYYARRFTTSLPVVQAVQADDFGFAAELGMNVGGIGMSVLIMSSLTPFFQEDGAPLAHQGTALFKLGYFF